MSEQLVCPRCGYVGPEDVLYCARCGRALAPPNVRFSRSVNRILDNVSPLHISLLGLVLAVLIGALADQLILIKLSFPWSLLPLALVIGCGFAYLGWHWHASLPDRRYLVRMFLVFAVMAVCLVVLWWVDGALLALLTDETHPVVFDIPGVYRQSTTSLKHMSIEAVTMSYALFVMLYGLLTALAGNLVHKGYRRRSA